MNKHMISLFVFLAAFAIMAAPGLASTTVGYCQTLSTPNTIYVLNQSIINQSGDCFSVGSSANNITLDCAGYTVDGTRTNNEFGFIINFPVNHTTIKNCKFTDWDNAIRNNGDMANYTTILNVTSSYMLDDGMTINCVGCVGLNITDFTAHNILGVGSGQFGLSVQNTNGAIIQNINISYGSNDGILLDNCENCNMTNVVVIDHVSGGLTLQDSDNCYYTDINVQNTGSTGIFHVVGTNSFFDQITITNMSSDSVFDYGFYHHSTSSNNTVTNMNIQDSGTYGFRDRGSDNVIEDSVFNNSGLHDLYPSSDCKNTQLTNVTGTGGYPIIYHNSDSAYTSSGETLSQLIVCHADTANIDDLTLTGNDNNGLTAYHVTSLDISGSTLTDFQDIRFYNTTFNITSSTFTDDEDGTILEFDSSGEFWLSTLTGNLTTVTMDNDDANTSLNTYNSQITRLSGDGSSGAIRLYCSGSSCTGTNTAWLLNTTLTDYSVTNSTLTLNWYLNVTNSLSASVIVKDAFSSTIDTFNDTLKQLTLIQYVVTPVDNQTNHTLHTIEATLAGYDPLSPTPINMNQDRDYDVSLTLTPSPVTGQFAALESSLIVLGVVLILIAIAFLMVRMEGGISIRELIMATVVIVIILIAVGFVQLTINAL